MKKTKPTKRKTTLAKEYAFFTKNFPQYTHIERNELIVLSPPFNNCTCLYIHGVGARARIYYNIFMKTDWTTVDVVLNEKRIDLRVGAEWKEFTLSDPRALPLRHLLLSFYQYPFLSRFMKFKHEPVFQEVELAKT